MLLVEGIMRYVMSGLVGFFLTLLLSVPFQQFLQLKEVQAVTMKAKYSGLGWRESEISVEVPPLAEASLDVRQPRVKFLPQYPPEAVASKLEGFVTLSYQVNKDGSVRNVKVLESQPPQVFDKAARRAVSRWIFSNAAANSNEEQNLRLVFSLKRNLASE